MPTIEEIRTRLSAAWERVRHSPVRMALVIGTGLAGVLAGSLLALTITSGRDRATADPSEPAALAPSTAASASEDPESTIALSPSPSTTASPSPSPTPTGTPIASPTPTPGVGTVTATPSPDAAQPTPSADLAVDWEPLSVPWGPRAAIASVTELESGEVAVILWSGDNSTDDAAYQVWVYDPDAGSWRDVALRGDSIPTSSNAEFVALPDGNVLHPAWRLESTLGITTLTTGTDEWTATDLGLVEEERSSVAFTELTATVVDGLVYVAEHVRSSRTTRFLTYDPASGALGTTSGTDGFLNDAFGDGTVAYAGDWNGRVDRYDPELDTWERYAPNLPSGEASYRRAAATESGRIWVPAYDAGAYAIWTWSPSVGDWQPVNTPAGDLDNPHLLPTSDGNLYVFSPTGSSYAEDPPE